MIYRGTVLGPTEVKIDSFLSNEIFSNNNRQKLYATNALFNPTVWERWSFRERSYDAMVKTKIILYTIPSLTIVGIAPKNNLPKLHTCYMTSKLWQTSKN